MEKYSLPAKLVKAVFKFKYDIVRRNYDVKADTFSVKIFIA